MYIYFCIYAHHAGFEHEVPKDSVRDFSLFLQFDFWDVYNPSFQLT